MLDAATTVQQAFEVRLANYEKSTDNVKHMGLDQHLQVSLMTGLIATKGASQYINDGPAQTSEILVCRAKSREEHLDLEFLIEQKKTIR